MGRLLFILSIFLVQQMHSIMPAGSVTLPLSGTVLTLNVFVYFLGEHYAMIAFSWLLYCEFTKYKVAFFTLFVLMVGDLVDYVLRYNSPWFSINGFEVSMNVFVFIIFGASIIYEAYRNDQ